MLPMYILRSAIFISGIIWAISAAAQVPPDAGRLLQETRPFERAPPAPVVPPIEAPARTQPTAPATVDDARVKVTHFTFTGNEALSTQTLEVAVAAWAGRSLNFGELIQAVEAVEARYKEAGYFLAQTYLPPQKIRDGAIEIAITEGRLAETRLEGESRVSPDVLYRYLDRLPKEQALRLPALERQILLINELAGGQARLDLQAGEKPGSTDVVLTQQADELLSGRLEANNHGAPSTGERRLGLTLNANSLFKQGERISLVALTSENRGLISYNLRGELPVGGDGWRLNASSSRTQYSLGGAFANLKASGIADSIRIGAGYPILRSRVASLRVQLETDQSRLADKFQTAGIQLDKQSRGVTAALSGDAIDDWMGGGSSRADVALRTGYVNLGATAAANDAPPAGPGTAGRFSKINLTAQRQQTLSKTMSLQAQLTWQLANKNLDSSEKLGLGGPSTLPGYANGEAVGDSGTHIKLGLSWQALPELILTAFTDYAKVKLAHDALPGVIKNTKQLSDYGISGDWVLGKHFSARAIVAWAGNEAPNPNDNAKPRVWLNIAYAW